MLKETVNMMSLKIKLMRLCQDRQEVEYGNVIVDLGRNKQ